LLSCIILTLQRVKIHELAERILHDISEPLALNNTIFKPSVSIGVALAPQHATKIKELLHLADKAMYSAKKAGGGQFVVANESANGKVNRKRIN